MAMAGGESEVYGLIKVWASVFSALTYCCALGKLTRPGAGRLVFVLPIVGLFLLLPLHLSSVHLCGSTAFFIAWLANFKLLMFALGKGPLASSNPPLSLPNFIAVASLPIKIQPNPPQDGGQKAGATKDPQKGHKSVFNYGIKLLLLGIMLRVYDYSDHLPQVVLWFIYGFHIYFCLEIILAGAAVLARAALGMELEPQFNEPYLSTSLQDFWGRRWNIMVTSILRPTVYEPVLSFSTRLISRRYAPLPAVFSTFVVSAIMHELIFYYLGRIRPTWEITGFFLFHGMCLMGEIAIKKQLRLSRGLPRPLAAFLTFSFVMVTAFWLFLPPLLRCRADIRAFEEYSAIGEFAKDVLSHMSVSKAFNTSR
ncbi:acyl-CoA--sterol O-acyltransferase 1-like [Punica granatum]|uniref:Wax synthase domain-containing protein n=2 Tax=Punica granatum TaxID=22663 RepID=A0A218XEH2_PUNGR|nr:acyl-CoA--sterol O-acyltransferase 1-like [Punica granatum]OWM83344.1 hypothetical protein CDL15_Pgr012825 [Punica granatum]PKI66403.1 hypothetical protein CRG98_013205 [Punica granatum]